MLVLVIFFSLSCSPVLAPAPARPALPPDDGVAALAQEDAERGLVAGLEFNGKITCFPRLFVKK